MKTILSAAVALLALGLPAQVQGYTITINNASFENPATATTNNNPPTGWTEAGTGGTGVWNINALPAGFWTVPAPDGNQVAFLSDAPQPGSSSSLSQVVANVEADTRYSLTGYVGHPINNQTVYTASLYAGAFLVGSTGGVAPLGSFAQFNVVYDSSLTPFFVGLPLRIQLESAFAQTTFDALNLQAPDGGLTVLLLGMSMAGLGWMRRKA
jgi:hypothetical protein